MKRRVVISGPVAWVLLAVSSVWCTYAVVTSGLTQRSRVRSALASAATEALPQDAVLSELGYRSGERRIVVLVGATRCGSCEPDRLSEPVQRIAAAIRRAQRTTGRDAQFVGVAIDAIRADGRQYLAALGDTVFDQEIIGGGWLNEGLHALAHAETHPGTSGIPVLAVYGERLVWGPDYRIDSLSERRVLLVARGWNEILGRTDRVIELVLRE